MVGLMSNAPIVMAFSKLPDPRSSRNRLYTLEDIVCTSILAMLCTCDDFHEISEWTDFHMDWLKSLGLCQQGAPSHDTYERFYRPDIHHHSSE